MPRMIEWRCADHERLPGTEPSRHGWRRRLRSGLLSVVVLAGFGVAGQELRFEEVSDRVGLGPEVIGVGVARCLFVDVNGDGRPDVVVHSTLPPPGREVPEPSIPVRFARVFLHTLNHAAALGFRYVEVEATGLPVLYPGDGLVFADLDNDGHRDAIITRYIDGNNEQWVDHGQRSGWQRGDGTGRFLESRSFIHAMPATTSAIAVGDVNRDGRLDLALGHWYTHYGASLEAFANELLIGPADPRQEAFHVEKLPVDGPPFDPETDLGGRPTYGMMIARLFDDSGHFQIIELNYGRRWNRLWSWVPPRRSQPHLVWNDLAPHLGVDGDAIRHGIYPEWLKERAKTDPRFDRADERPFRANGNSFDCAVGDIDNDGDFDLFISEITHGWAGESSDRSRFLVQGVDRAFASPPHLNVDRIPEGINNWNQGDLFCELADFNHDGRLDLLLSSGDYPDNQRLRLFLQEADGSFRDVTAEVGLDHDGSQMISLADVDGDGALDILVGQTFNRFTPEQREGREPRMRLFVSRFTADDVARSLTLRLEGRADEAHSTNRDALGALVRVRIGDLTMQRQLIGIGGHAGKQHDFLVHFGLAGHERIDELIVTWPNQAGAEQRFEDVPFGRYTLRQGEPLQPIP